MTFHSQDMADPLAAFVATRSAVLEQLCDVLEELHFTVLHLRRQLAAAAGQGQGSWSKQRQLRAELETAEQLYAAMYDQGKEQAAVITKALQQQEGEEVFLGCFRTW